jgi:hypothetical protein
MAADATNGISGIHDSVRRGEHTPSTHARLHTPQRRAAA